MQDIDIICELYKRSRNSNIKNHISFFQTFRIQLIVQNEKSILVLDMNKFFFFIFFYYKHFEELWKNCSMYLNSEQMLLFLKKNLTKSIVKKRILKILINFKKIVPY